MSKPRTKGKSAAVRVYEESQALCNLDTQAVLNQIDHYLNTYPKPGCGSKDSDTSEDDLEYGQQHFSDDLDPDATQLPGPGHNIPAYHGANFESQTIL